MIYCSAARLFALAAQGFPEADVRLEIADFKTLLEVLKKDPHKYTRTYMVHVKPDPASLRYLTEKEKEPCYVSCEPEQLGGFQITPVLKITDDLAVARMVKNWRRKEDTYCCPFKFDALTDPEYLMKKNGRGEMTIMSRHIRNHREDMIWAQPIQGALNACGL